MNRTHLKLLSVCLLLALAGVITADAQVASADDMIRLGNIKTSKIETPKYETKRSLQSYPSATREQNWLEIALPYKTSIDWMDELSITFYVLIEPKDDPAVKQKILVGTVDYVNIKKGVHRSVVYLHPSTLERFGEPKRYAAIVRTSMDGRPMELATEDMTPWRRLAPESGLVLNRMQTPFAMVNFSDFEALRNPQEKK
ncbi:MAG: hypothetical protein PHP44_13340 [Kiritimatiellae bacterium]|nr:hypothetical protein [Kiritimatiellia bacterium]MDD4737075.1 hypothetical protein [Kiritimatiellia bacterium]